MVAALGGISAHRHVSDFRRTAPRLVGRTWSVRAGRSTPNGSAYSASITSAVAAHRQDPRPGEPFPSISTYDQAECCCALVEPPWHRVAARLCGCLLRWHGRAGVRRAVSRRVGRMRRDQRGAIAPSDVYRLAQRAARDRAFRARAQRRRGRPRAGARACHGDVPERRRVRSSASRCADIDGDGRFVFPVEGYLFSRGEDYAAHYRPRSFVCLSESIDLHRREPAAIATPTTVVAHSRGPAGAPRRRARFAERLAGTRRFVEISSVLWPRCLPQGSEQLHPSLRRVTRGHPMSDTTSHDTRRAGSPRILTRGTAPSCRPCT